MIEIKRTKVENIDKIYEIQRLCFETDFQKYQDFETSPYCQDKESLTHELIHFDHYSIFNQGKCVGAIVIRRIQKQRAHIYKLFIHPSMQGKGFGKYACSYMENEFSNIPYWTVYTPHLNFANHRFYESLGYKKYKETLVNDKLTLYQYEKRR